MRKTTGRLADGREIIYFDEDDDTVRRVDDGRDLPPRAGPSNCRYDVLTDEWVTVAPHRQSRTHLPPPDQCPLCPTRDAHLTEIPSPDYDVVVFENRFPSFTHPLAAVEADPTAKAAPTASAARAAEGAPASLGAPATEGAPTALATSATEAAPSAGDFFRQRPGVGRSEVVCFTSEHNSSFSALTPGRARTVVEAWADRTAAMSALPGVAEVFCFENRGREIGVTLSHPHGQVYGYPFVTPRTGRMLDAARRYRDRTGGNLFEYQFQAEVGAGVRVVAQTAHWTAFVPFAARWPVEVHLYPNDRVASIPELSEGQRDDFCGVYLDLLRRLERVHGPDLPYIAGWHQAPVRVDRDLGYLHLQIFSTRRAPGRLKYLAGSESAMGAFVNDVAPEEIARALRDFG